MIVEEKYPKDFQEFLQQFRTDNVCWNYLFEMRWPNGFQCPKCSSDKYWITEKKLIHCMICEHQASVTANTIFHATRKPLILWFHIIWWVVAHFQGFMVQLVGFNADAMSADESGAERQEVPLGA